jgi:MFS family permease
LLNGAQVIGQIILGWVSDFVNVFVLLVTSTICSALLAGFLWFLAADFGQLLAFSMLYGLFAGGYSVLWPRFVTVLTKDSATSLWLYGLLAFQRGLGNIAAGPISVALYRMSSGFNKDPSSGYRGMILFVAAAFLVSSCGGTGFYWQRKQKRRISTNSL